MKTALELRDVLAQAIVRLNNGEISPGQARELSRLTNSMINSARAQLEAAKINNTQPNIAFLKDDDGE
jgi:hypothetical protein